MSKPRYPIARAARTGIAGGLHLVVMCTLLVRCTPATAQVLNQPLKMRVNESSLALTLSGIQSVLPILVDGDSTIPTREFVHRTTVRDALDALADHFDYEMTTTTTNMDKYSPNIGRTVETTLPVRERLTKSGGYAGLGIAALVGYALYARWVARRYNDGFTP